MDKVAWTVNSHCAINLVLYKNCRIATGSTARWWEANAQNAFPCVDKAHRTISLCLLQDQRNKIIVIKFIKNVFIFYLFCHFPWTEKRGSQRWECVSQISLFPLEIGEKNLSFWALVNAWCYIAHLKSKCPSFLWQARRSMVRSMGLCRCGESHQYLPWEPTTNFLPRPMGKCKKNHVVVNTRFLFYPSGRDRGLVSKSGFLVEDFNGCSC